MKKFFAFLMAAAALMTGCNNPEPDDKPDNKEEEKFYGLTLNDAEVLNRGDYYGDGTNSYLVYLYKVESEQKTRIFAGEIITPEVNDGVIPAGKYTIEEGGLVEGDIEPILDGSFFVRNVEEDGFIMLVTEGYLEVKHLETAGEYELTASFKGIDANTGEAKPVQEGRFTGAPRMIGLPASNNYEVFTPYGAQAMYVPIGDGIAGYDILLASQGAFDGETFPVKMAEFVIISEDLGVEALPQGTFPIDYFLGGAYLNIQLANAMITIDANGDATTDEGRDGYITIKAKGEGKYSIEAVTFTDKAGYKQKYEGEVYIFEESAAGDRDEIALNVEGAALVWLGDGVWQVQLLDSTLAQGQGVLLAIYAFGDENSTINDGLASGTYAFTDTQAAGTALAGYVSSQGAGGSLALTADGQYYYDYLGDGQMEVVNNGDGTYTISVASGGDEYYFTAEYSGEVAVYDDTTSGGGSSDAIALNIESMEMYYLGIGEWIVYLTDPTCNQGMGANLMLDVILAEDATFEQGLATGTYTFADTYDPMTIYPGYVDEEGYLSGSMVLAVAQQGAYDYVDNGSMTVTNNGDGTYAVEFLVSGSKYAWQGSYSGAATAEDATQQGVAPKKAAKKLAPAKSAKVFEKNAKLTWNPSVSINSFFSFDAEDYRR
ncbi:MAG: hypothetical protein J6K24_03745 [Tidjanibacter sp.]|nr:hypothetical protein [Tidjanibacter sp.]